MEYRQLGKSGLRVSALGLGCNPFGNEVDKPGAANIVSAAIDNGITYFDTANTYFAGRSEEYLGAALVGRRDDVIVATKFGNKAGPGPNDTGTSRKHIMKAVEDSLRRLQTDYIDVYQIHSPDRSVPIEETMLALDDLVQSGKVRYIGCSNMFEWEIEQAQGFARANGLAQFASAQDFYNILFRDIEKRMEPYCVKTGLGMIPYFPLAGGLLGGVFKRDVTPEPGSGVNVRIRGGTSISAPAPPSARRSRPGIPIATGRYRSAWWTSRRNEVGRCRRCRLPSCSRDRRWRP